MFKWIMCSALNSRVANSIPTMGSVVLKLRQFLLLHFALLISDETLNAVGPCYRMSMPGEVKDPTRLTLTVYLTSNFQ